MTVVEEESLDEELVAKSKRSRKRLIVILIICFALVVVAAATCIFLLQNKGPLQASLSTTQIETQLTDESSASGATTKIPTLASLVGKTVPDALKLLGTQAALVGTEPTTEESNAAITQLATISIAATAKGAASSNTAASSNGASPSTTESAKLYLSLDASSIILEVYYVVPLQLLSHSSTDFKQAIGDETFIKESLVDAGLPLTSLQLVQPTAPGDYQTLSATGEVSKESWAFQGATGLAAAPQNWTLTVVYDHSIGLSTGNVGDSTRVMTLRLY